MRLRATFIVITVLIASLMAQAVFAAGQTYVDKRRVINAGVLQGTYLNTGVTPNQLDDAATVLPYIFYIMDQRDDLKPQGWTFVNPLAGGDNTYKNQSSYWLVSLKRTSVENLSKFDILYLSAIQTLSFGTAERDKLRKYVDGGGCLWVDPSRSYTGLTFFDTKTAYEFFLPGVNFKSGVVSVNPTVAAKLHPVLTNPFTLSPQEIYSLNRASHAINPGFTSSLNALPNPTLLAPIVMDAAGPTMAAIEYGSGRVLFTAGCVGDGIQGQSVAIPIPAGLNGQNSNLMLASPAHLRFAYNVVNWASSWTTSRKGYKQSGSSPVTISGRLTNKWKVAEAIAPGSTGTTGSESSPVFWKNVVYFSGTDPSNSGGMRLYAIDATPENDLDGDGNPDDGQPDINSSGDIIWESGPLGKISSPTVATMLDPASGSLVPKDFVLVTGDDGNVHIFEALSTGPNGGINPGPVERRDLWKIPSGSDPKGGSGDYPLLPPVVQNGWIYEFAPEGAIYAHSPVLAAVSVSGMTPPKTPWTIKLVNPGTVDVRCGMTLGFIKNKSTGTIAQNLTVVGMPKPAGDSTSYNDHLYSMPIYVSGDRLKPVPPITGSTSGDYNFNCSYPGTPIASYPPPEVWAVNPDGSTVTCTIDKIYLDNPVLGPIPINIGGTVGPNTRFYMSYAPDYSSALGSGYTVPCREIMPKISGAAGYPKLMVGGTPALGSDDNYYMCVNWDGLPSSGSATSAAYAMVWDGSSGLVVKWNYTLHSGGKMPDPTTTVNGNATIPVSDPLGGWGVWGIFTKSTVPGNPPTYAPAKNLTANTSPAIADGRVFITATADSGGYLICLKANPKCQIKLNRSLYDEAKGKMQVAIWQPDMLTDPTTVVPNKPITQQLVPLSADMVDYDTGLITITDFNRVKTWGFLLGNVMQTNTFSTSLPVFVFLNGVVVPPDEVDLSSWNNLIWAMPIQGHGGITSSPVIMGDYVYFTCDDGFLCSVAVDAIPATQELDGTPNDDALYRVLDPHSKFVNTPMQMLDDVGAPCKAKTSIAGTGGVIAVPTTGGLYGYGSSLTLVTDNHRVMEIGSDGKISWSCDTAVEPLQSAGAAVINNRNLFGRDTKSLNRPTIAQKYSGSDYLVVDSGNDRVIRMDRAGQITWSLTNFTDPGDLLRSGESKTIKAPADAKMWSEYEVINGTRYYVLHCMVADSGNFRILDIVDRYNTDNNGQILGVTKPGPDGKPIHELKWVSSTSYRDNRYRFTSIQLVQGVNSNSLPTGQVWASVGNYGLQGTSSPVSPGGGSTSGAVLGMKYREASAPFTWTYQDGSPVGQLTTLKNMTGSGPDYITLAGPTYFTVIDSTVPKLLICDASAVYLTNGTNIEWKLTNEQYSKLRRQITDAGTLSRPWGSFPTANAIPFTPKFCQMLPGNSAGFNRIMIANSYAGPTNEPNMVKFVGEVFEVEKGPGSIIGDIVWYSPEIWRYPTGELVQMMSNSTNLDQPTCAIRLN